MSKFIVLANSGEVLSIHKSLDLAEKSAKKLSGYVVETESAVKKGDLFELPVSNDVEAPDVDQELAECDELVAGQKARTALDDLATLDIEKWADEIQPTITYIAKPEDSRCSWWCVQVPEDQQLDGTRINASFLKRGADLELKSGDMLIDSEANHYRKNRGYRIVLVVCGGEKVQYLRPTAHTKAFIKAHGGQDLMRESGDVNGCIRMAVWLRRQADFKPAVDQLLACC
jgi:hypothetical protein